MGSSTKRGHCGLHSALDDLLAVGDLRVIVWTSVVCANYSNWERIGRVVVVPLRSPPGNKVLPDPKLISSSKWRPDAPVPFTAKQSVAAEENGSNTGVVKKRQWRTRIGAAPADFGMKGERMFKAWRDNLGDQWDTFKTEGKNACGILEHMAAFLWPRRNLKAKVGGAGSNPRVECAWNHSCFINGQESPRAPCSSDEG